jgi:hypothetical protein
MEMKRIFLVVVLALALSPGQPIAKMTGVEQDGKAATETVAAGGSGREAFAEARKNADAARSLVVARVNGAEISMFSLVRMMNQLASRQVSPEEITDEVTARIRMEALDQLIFEEMAIQASYEKGISIKDEEIDEVVENVKENLGNDEAFREYLGRLGLTEEQLRRQIERSRRRELVTSREIYSKVKVDEEAIKAEYGELKKAGRLRIADEFIISDILVMNGKNEEETRQRAETLLAQVKKNKGEFGKLVMDGTFITRQLRIDKESYPVIHARMQQLAVGDLSGVIQDGGAFHIFKIVRNEPGRDLSFEEARGSLENRLRGRAQEERKAAWKEELKRNMKVEIFLQELDARAQKQAENRGSGRRDENVSGPVGKSLEKAPVKPVPMNC